MLATYRICKSYTCTLGVMIPVAKIHVCDDAYFIT